MSLGGNGPRFKSPEEFAALSPRSKGYAVYWMGQNPDEPHVPATYTPSEEERAEYERGQRQAVLDAQDSEE